MAATDRATATGQSNNKQQATKSKRNDMVVQMKAEGWIQMCALPVLLQHYDRTTRHSGARTNNLNLAFCITCMQRSTKRPALLLYNHHHYGSLSLLHDILCIGIFPRDPCMW